MIWLNSQKNMKMRMNKVFKSKAAKWMILFYIGLPIMYVTYKYVRYFFAKKKGYDGSFPKYCFGTIFNLV